MCHWEDRYNGRLLEGAEEIGLDVGWKRLLPSPKLAHLIISRVFRGLKP